MPRARLPAPAHGCLSGRPPPASSAQSSWGTCRGGVSQAPPSRTGTALVTTGPREVGLWVRMPRHILYSTAPEPGVPAGLVAPYRSAGRHDRSETSRSSACVIATKRKGANPRVGRSSQARDDASALGTSSQPNWGLPSRACPRGRAGTARRDTQVLPAEAPGNDGRTQRGVNHPARSCRGTSGVAMRASGSALAAAAPRTASRAGPCRAPR